MSQQNQQSKAGRRERLQDKVALIVGAGRGIGEAIALRFAAEGAKLMLSAGVKVRLSVCWFPAFRTAPLAGL